MGFGSRRRRWVRRTTALCAVAALGPAVLAGCGGDADESAGGGGPAPQPGAPAPPASGVGGGGASGAPEPMTRAHLRFVRRVDAACRSVAVQPVVVGRAVGLERAKLLARERLWLRQLARALRTIRAPREDQERMRRYRRALRSQILLDGILANGLRAEDGEGGRPGVEAGERQNGFNRAARTTLARRLDFSRCLFDHAG